MTISYDVDVLPGIDNGLGHPLFLPKVNEGVDLPLDGQGVVTHDTTYELPVVGGAPPVRVTARAGTRVTFKPDPSIMTVTEYNFDTLAQRLRELAFLNKGLKITLTDERVDPVKEATFHYTGGIAEFIRHLNKGKQVLHEKPIHFEAERPLPNGGMLTMEVSLQYNDGYSENLFSFANNINTVDGGTHLTGFRTALTRTINNFASSAGMLKEQKDEVSITGDDAYANLRYESGGHRVQRVPKTEQQGRIHTSAATVAVLPEPDEVQIDVRDQDIAWSDVPESLQSRLVKADEQSPGGLWIHE